MFETLKELLCIHNFGIVNQTRQRDGIDLYTYCNKCGKGKFTKIKTTKPEEIKPQIINVNVDVRNSKDVSVKDIEATIRKAFDDAK